MDALLAREGPEGFAAAWIATMGMETSSQYRQGARMAVAILVVNDSNGTMIWRTQDAYCCRKRCGGDGAAIKVVTYFIQGLLAIWAISALVGGFWKERPG